LVGLLAGNWLIDLFYVCVSTVTACYIYIYIYMGLYRRHINK